MFTKAPTFLDNKSGFKKEQVQVINNLLKSYYNDWVSSKVQKQKDKPQVIDSMKEVNGRVRNVQVKFYNEKYLEIYFELDTTGLSVGESLDLMKLDEFPKNIIIQSFSGFYDETLKESVDDAISLCNIDTETGVVSIIAADSLDDNKGFYLCNLFVVGE